MDLLTQEWSAEPGLLWLLAHPQGGSGKLRGRRESPQRPVQLCPGIGCREWRQAPAQHPCSQWYAKPYGSNGRGGMGVLSATEARKRLYALIDEVGQSHEPVRITGKRGNAVLLSEDDWRSIQETLHLVSIPGMRESIMEGMATPLSELSSDPGW